MNDDSERTQGSKRTRRLIEQADKLARSGRVTTEEGSRLRAARSPAEIDQVVRDIRVRHAGARMDTAVEEGAMSPEEAEGFLARLRSGEHPRGLRSHLAQFRTGQEKKTTSSGTPGRDEGSSPPDRTEHGEPGKADHR